MVRAKKHLGQHFLTDDNIARKIAESLHASSSDTVLEIGPGTGKLTAHLCDKFPQLYVADIDSESIDYLQAHFPQLQDRVFYEDFLKMDLERFRADVNIIGNFPYNISSQILFKVYDNMDIIPEVVGMFQKEVAQRVASPPGNKTYGILSVLLQAFYDIEYLFTVSENVFNPPPKVKSGVIRLARKKELPNIDRKLFKQVVKTAFNQRRKTLRNSLKSMLHADTQHELLSKRPEQLHYSQFMELTEMIAT